MKISIITPSFNQGTFIEETIRSVQEQNHADIEHIVVDGGSTDGTIAVLKRFPHLRWISEKDEGQSDAINKGFGLAGGEIVAWLNSDDWYERNVLGDVAKYFEDHPDCMILYGDITFVDKAGKRLYAITGDTLSYDHLVASPDSVRQPSFFWRRALLAGSGGLDRSLHLVMDLDFFLRIGRGRRFHYLPRNISYYRFYDENKSLSLARRQVKEMVRVYRKNTVPFTPRILRILATKYLLTFEPARRARAFFRKERDALR
jgi:glycosyltransferase involved in cell wall biosynthesis